MEFFVRGIVIFVLERVVFFVGVVGKNHIRKIPCTACDEEPNEEKSLTF